VVSTLSAGCISGALASGLCTPADVIKTRLQVKGGKKKYGGIAGCFRSIVQNEGPAALFKGVGPRMAVVAPLFGISLLAFEVQKSYMLSRAKAHNTNEWRDALQAEAAAAGDTEQRSK
jgi:solute carrier family 25 aspartate/glutamate transporter 12/13